MAAIAACRTCGTTPLENARFCHGCGSPAHDGETRAEYKQVTVLFADVVHSMDIAATVGAERLREIMADLVGRSAAVVERYGGTVDKFTGDGIMAVFGAPAALEDHAVRACMAALGIQEEAKRLAVDVRERDGLDLQLRVGLNSGEVIAGEIGSGSFGYTAVGEQVGMAQRMESIAPRGGVMLSASTARLVEKAATLGESALVQLKGVDEPVPARRLLGMGEGHRVAGRAESKLVGRRWEMSAVEGLLERAIDGHGAVVGVVGPPGIGKSRLVREVAAMAAQRDLQVYAAFCESHTGQVPFHVVSRLLREATGVEGLEPQTARAVIRRQAFSDAEPEDLVLFEDLLGIRDSDAPPPRIDPDARRRRLTAMVNSATLANRTPAVYVIEDAHWIDGSSESMLADFLTVVPRTPLLTIVTYRPEYRGALARVPGAQTIALAPLRDSETAALVFELLGPDPTVGELGRKIAERASGTPFFVEEIVRELTERGVLQGTLGGYVSTAEAAEVKVPATLQATIAARIDRLSPESKRSLSAAAVIGSRFSLDLLTVLVAEPVVSDLVAGQLIDQVRFTRQPEYVFHHPLIRAVAYESQLKSDRAELHRRLAAAIEERTPASADENAALIAEHLEAAGDLRAAYAWRMRAGAWSATRDIRAAWVSWDRARQIADALSDDDPDRISMRIAARTMLCGNGWRVDWDISKRLDELRELCTAAGDKASLAIGMVGLVPEHYIHGRVREASQVASELTVLVESIGDPTLLIGFVSTIPPSKFGTGEMRETLRYSQTVIDLAHGDPTKGNLIIGAPLAFALAMRGTARYALGDARWRGDFDRAVEMARGADSFSRAMVSMFAYAGAMEMGVALVDDAALRDIEEALGITEQSGDDLVLGVISLTMGIALMHRESSADRERGLKVLGKVRELCRSGRFYLSEVRAVDMYTARETARRGDREGALPVLRAAVEEVLRSGQFGHSDPGTAALVETLLEVGGEGEIAEAQAAIERLAAAPAEDGLVICEVWLLRMWALLARARGDETRYCEYRDRYRDMATSLGFEGHMKWAAALP
ncbi:cyclase [Mycobacterium vulneris]|uniref:Cyclase n=1 Tax=Mycolicibacterium vulneris TaxID=547163 RepID=A0A1X2LEE3_9MYCO|nr:adenylate/guanylate cyclase domain-containing protein [Mycolicibacterium vulneris]OSC32317.1 cyclase [Mycolicibacterium vulneris]